MCDTQARVNLAFGRAKRRKKRQRDGLIVKLRVACCAMLALNLAVVANLSDPIQYHTPENWMYGATLLPSHAGSYVLVAMVTFVIAVTVTVLCMKRQEKEKHQEDEG